MTAEAVSSPPRAAPKTARNRSTGVSGHLVFDNVSRFFGRIEAVKDVSFELQPAEIVCLLGPSGCGKTTVLRIAAGVDRPARGRVVIGGEEVAGPACFVPPERRHIGLMFQDFALFPHMTILRNVAFGLKGLRRADAERESMQGLERVGLARYAHAYPHVLSGGEQQRVALARALAPRPGVMLMDEPFSGLDERLRENVRSSTLAVLKESRATCLMVTHDSLEAMEMADRILLMRQGRLVQSGTPRDLFHRPVDLEAARFFSDFNELKGIIRAGRAATPLGDFVAAGIPDHSHATVMIRPQGFSMLAGGVGHEGYVLEARHIGDIVQCRVLFKGIGEPLLIRVAARSGLIQGQTAVFAVDADRVLVFATGH